MNLEHKFTVLNLRLNQQRKCMLSLLKYFKDQSLNNNQGRWNSSASFSPTGRSDDEWTWSSEVDEKNLISSGSTTQYLESKGFKIPKIIKKRKPSHRIHPLLVVRQFSICAQGVRTLLAQRVDMEPFSTNGGCRTTEIALHSLKLPSTGLERVSNPLNFHQEQEVVENLAERFHAVFFVKVFLFIFLFDLEIEYLSLLSLVFFLHVNGVFEPLLRWIRTRRERWRQAQPLHRVLRNLERRNQLQAIERVALLNLQQQISQQGSLLPSTTAISQPTNDRPNVVEPMIPAAIPPLADDGMNPPETQHASNLEPSQFKKYLYQTVVMYFGTSLPWWKPDQRYLV